MTKEDIIAMAREAWLSDKEAQLITEFDEAYISCTYLQDLERFAKLVAQHERERIKQANAPEIERVNVYIKKLEAALEAKDEPDAYGYAKRLAEAIWSKHYKTIAPQWEPFDELIGVLTQIDNMTAGLISPTQRKPMTNDEIVAEYDKFKADKEAKGEPVAWVYPEFWQHLENLNCGTAYRLTGIGRQPLYTTPPQRTWVGLTDEEFKQIMLAIYNIDLNVLGHSSDDYLLWNAIEAKLRSKNYD